MSKGRQIFSTGPSGAHRLSVVAGPLGNAGDVTLRALEELREADLIFCEDTRKLRPLLETWGIEASLKKLHSLPGQTEHETDFRRFLEFSHWVFLSDAGTPVVNDPGSALIAWARAQNFKVEALPGPCAPILLWQWTGGFGLPFHFAGFAPKTRNATELDRFFQRALVGEGTFCFFDTRHQVLNTLDYLAQHESWKEVPLYLGREMTKTFEELLHDRPGPLREHLQARLLRQEGIGELTLLVPAQAQREAAPSLSLEDLARIREAPPKEAAKILSRLTGQSVKSCYDRLIEK